MSGKLQIKTCPTCGSDRIKRVVRDISRKYKGAAYIVPKVEFYDCPNCGEKVYDHAAMQKIQSYSPAYRKTRATMSLQGRRFKSSRNSPVSPA
ncbi:MAG: type II toxin-antitoxin system MqsA family antitoxin [Anaerolineales bacterium]|nr:type II toxin-antitoxin system MqsA family antitoxin [Anaerolineales bacterium]